jgi:hypothetical protein
MMTWLRGTSLLCCVCSAGACAGADGGGEFQPPIAPSTLVAEHADSCPPERGAAATAGARAARAGDAHWDRVAFDGHEAVRSIRLTREARGCFERAGLPAERAAQAERLRTRERALYMAVQGARRALGSARAGRRDAEALAHAERLLALLDPASGATAELRGRVERYVRAERRTLATTEVRP